MTRRNSPYSVGVLEWPTFAQRDFHTQAYGFSDPDLLRRGWQRASPYIEGVDMLFIGQVRRNLCECQLAFMLNTAIGVEGGILRVEKVTRSQKSRARKPPDSYFVFVRSCHTERLQFAHIYSGVEGFWVAKDDAQRKEMEALIVYIKQIPREKRDRNTFWQQPKDRVTVQMPKRREMRLELPGAKLIKLEDHY